MLYSLALFTSLLLSNYIWYLYHGKKGHWTFNKTGTQSFTLGIFIKFLLISSKLAMSKLFNQQLNLYNGKFRWSVQVMYINLSCIVLSLKIPDFYLVVITSGCTNIWWRQKGVLGKISLINMLKYLDVCVTSRILETEKTFF